MRFFRDLSSPQRWDIGLLLALLMVASLCISVCWSFGAIPTLWAEARQPAAAIPAPQSNSANQVQTTSAIPPAAFQNAPLPAIPVPAVAAASKKQSILYRWFGGQKYRYWKTVRMHVTAYAPDSQCCWPYDGKTTASGASVTTNHGKLVAADTRLIPMHALVSIPGYSRGQAVPVLDRGAAIKGQRLDVLMPTFDAARNWGAQDIDVKVYLPVD